MKAIRNMKKDESAVSPIVATLVLIVVAVVGAVAVGTIMGTFSSDVSKTTNTGDLSAASSNEVLIAGSTTVQPASEEIAKVYMKNHPGMKITVQGGGSGAGVSSVGAGIVDIGSSSDLPKITTAQADHPDWDLRQYQIGGSGVVFIATNDVAVTGNVSKAELIELYNNGTVPADLGGATGVTQVYQRAESSGTEETVAKWLSAGSSLDAWDASPGTVDMKSATGNSGVYAAIRDSNAKAVGFVDMGYVYDSAGNQITDSVGKITILSIDTFPNTSRDNIKDAAKIKANSPTATSTKYDVGLARGLYYMTKGEPNSVVKNYITFAQSPGADDAIHAAGVFSNSDLA